MGECGVSAAVCGQLFASPSEDAVFEAIRKVSGLMGTLVVVMNYQGDVIHFGAAVERAKSEGYDVEMIVVRDDVSIHDRAQRRGICGTVLALKLACCMAEAGMSLEVMTAEMEALEDHMGSMGVGLEPCSLPGQFPPSRLGPTECEIGMGIHNEPGTERTEMMSVDDLTDLSLYFIFLFLNPFFFFIFCISLFL